MFKENVFPMSIGLCLRFDGETMKLFGNELRAGMLKKKTRVFALARILGGGGGEIIPSR